MDAERVHDLAMGTLGRFGSVLQKFAPAPDVRLERTVFGIRFPNPVGLAAGFDKNAVALRAWEGLGFGFAEVGTITARAQPGNPKPRIFRLPEHRALINRLGFNNDGADAVASRLRREIDARRWPRIPIGINIGKSRQVELEAATADYVLSLERLLPFGDYFVLNVSSPNTPGLRTLQDRKALDHLLESIQRRNTGRKPLLVKLAPDLSNDALEDAVALAAQHKLAGIVATNTTVDHSAIPEARRQQGGLSGAPLRQRATEVVRFLAERSKLPIIAVGGIDSVDAALEKLDAGAALIQLYTGFIYEGPGLIRDINKALVARAAA
jgi:dihydroorotate dehydrogenase